MRMSAKCRDCILATGSLPWVKLNLVVVMRDLTPWLGLCHIRKETDDPRSSRKTLVAVWVESIEGFEREVHFHTNTHGLQMIGTEEVLPAADWLAKHPDRKDGQRLAGKVSAKHPVAFGALGGRETGAGVGGETEDEGYLHIEEIGGVEPLDSQFGVHPPKTVPDALYEPLFGQPEITREDFISSGQHPGVIGGMKVYAILDVGKINSLLNSIEESGCAYRCLFQGKAAEEFRETAPYIVQLEPTNDFTKNVFSDTGSLRDIWGTEAGIFIRSRESIDQLRKHFRKFTRVQVEADKRWVYFRFWEPIMITHFLRGTGQSNLEAFFKSVFEIHTYDDTGKWLRITLRNRPPKTHTAAFLLQERDFQSFKIYVQMRYYYQLKKWILENFHNPRKIDDIDGFLRSEVSFAIDKFQTNDKRIIAHYAAASWLLGERAYSSARINQNGVRANAGGAKRLYDRAFQYCYMLEGKST